MVAVKTFLHNVVPESWGKKFTDCAKMHSVSKDDVSMLSWGEGTVTQMGDFKLKRRPLEDTQLICLTEVSC